MKAMLAPKFVWKGSEHQRALVLISCTDEAAQPPPWQLEIAERIAAGERIVIPAARSGWTTAHTAGPSTPGSLLVQWGPHMISSPRHNQHGCICGCTHTHLELWHQHLGRHWFQSGPYQYLRPHRHPGLLL